MLVFQQIPEAFHKIEIVHQPIPDDNGSHIRVIQGIPDLVHQIQNKDLHLIRFSQQFSHSDIPLFLQFHFQQYI
jgi:hypothetical protein